MAVEEIGKSFAHLPARLRRDPAQDRLRDAGHHCGAGETVRFQQLSIAPGLGLTPKMETLGAPVAVIE